MSPPQSSSSYYDWPSPTPAKMAMPPPSSPPPRHNKSSFKASPTSPPLQPTITTPSSCIPQSPHHFEASPPPLPQPPHHFKPSPPPLPQPHHSKPSPPPFHFPPPTSPSLYPPYYPIEPPHPSSKSTTIIITCTFSALALFLLFGCLLCCIIRKKKTHKHHHNCNSDVSSKNVTATTESTASHPIDVPPLAQRSSAQYPDSYKTTQHLITPQQQSNPFSSDGSISASGIHITSHSQHPLP